jgi:hypothetical protein
LLVYVAKDLLRTPKLAAMEEKLQAEVSCQVDSNPSSLGFAIAIDAGEIAASLAQAFFESFSYHVGRALNKSDSFHCFLATYG